MSKKETIEVSYLSNLSFFSLLRAKYSDLVAYKILELIQY